VQYTTVQYSTVHYSTIQYSTVQYSTVQYSTVQHTAPQSVEILGVSAIQLGKEIASFDTSSFRIEEQPSHRMDFSEF
jgi:hypothetical protein